ncbi:hypothetical protein [Gilvimarinus japonicus]|uniref:Hemerythrin-like domain-containing protein n=1 Tax=Gilvimarinus japonicus TaxID=1796469 RepID=A0ABV7HVR4_9GAMM
MFVCQPAARPYPGATRRNRPITAYLRELTELLTQTGTSDARRVQTGVNICVWQLRQFAARQYETYYPFLHEYDPVLANRLEDRHLKFASALDRLECAAHSETLGQARSCVPAPTVAQLWRRFNRDYRAHLNEQAATLLPVLSRYEIAPVAGTPATINSIL